VNLGIRGRVAVTAATTVLAFVALLVPGIAGALNLTTLGKVLSLAAVALLTAAGQRLAKRLKDRQAVSDAVRVWPPEPLGVARLETLGVFPARGATGRVTRYQPRPRGEDDELAGALRASKNVIVHGPARCGKSRAASQAASQSLGDIPAVIPLDADALGSMLDGGVCLPVAQQRICLWLDGLDRFMSVLDPCSLAALDKVGKPEIMIVATIRTEQWTELVDANGQSREAARALAQDAQIVQLGPFSPGAPVEPVERVEPVEPADEPARPTGGDSRSPWQDTVLGVLVAGLLALIVAAVLLRGDLLTPPSIGDQMSSLMSSILAGAGPGGGHVVVDERVQFHATDQPSWLLVVEDLPTHDEFTAGAAEGAHPRPRSDELRIYDVVGGRLRLKLHFRPRGVGPTAAEWHTLEAGATPAADYDGDGSLEAIAGYALPSQATDALLPFGIDWEDGHYQLVSLTTTVPQLGTGGLDAETVGFRRAAYETQITLKNAVSEPRFSGLKLAGYRVQTFALAQKPSLRLITGYLSAFPEFGKTHVLEMHASQFRTGRLGIAPCTPGFYACPAPRAEQGVFVPPDKALDNGLLEAWNMVGHRWTTQVRVLQLRG
jgi:hypothetical protein